MTYCAGPVSDSIYFKQIKRKEKFDSQTLIEFMTMADGIIPRIVMFCQRIEDCSQIYLDLVEQLKGKYKGSIQVRLIKQCIYFPFSHSI